jgi:hypothetical protein
MNQRKITWFMATILLTLLAVATAPAFPQDDPGGSDDATASGGAADSGQTAGQDVEDIIRAHEQTVKPGQFRYDPEGRRDPFRSLLQINHQNEGPRPPGIEGMAVDEIDLTGIVDDPNGGNLAYFTGSDNKGYFLRVGNKVYNATMISIDLTGGTVTFRQKVDDPRQIKPYRDIVRRLVPLEGEQ